VVPAGHAQVMAEAADLREDVKFAWDMAPYSLSLAVDGHDAGRILFDSLQVTEGKMVVGGTKLSRSDLYAGDGLLRCGGVDLAPGPRRLRLAVRDFAGNETVRDFAVTVQE